VHCSRRAFLAGALALPASVLAQERGRTSRVVLLEQWFATAPSGPARRLVKSLEDLGYQEGRNISFDWRFPGGDPVRLSRQAEEIVALRPDVVVVMGAVSTRAMAKATATLPILAWMGDPVSDGFAHASLKPKGNVTGFADRDDERFGKLFELLKSFVPGFARFGMLEPAGSGMARGFMGAMGPAAEKLGVQVVPESFASRAEIERALTRFRAMGVRVALGSPAPGVIDLGELVQLALRHRIGLVGEGIGARHGLLLTLSPEIDARRLAVQLDKLLRGTPVADVPFELPTRFVVAINRKIASELGLAIPAEVYLRADEVLDDWTTQK
jgi:putative ABC transport system substrate-binding protein